MLVTLRRAQDLPSLRSEPIHHELWEAARETRIDGFRITRYAVRPDHVHLLVEADDVLVLAVGLKSFGVRAARGVNRVIGRSGTVWAERHHRRELRSPREVRDALGYLLSTVEPPAETSPLATPDTWLLRAGWLFDTLAAIDERWSKREPGR